MTQKRRLSVSIDAELAAAGRARVEAGEVESLSAWVNEALQHQTDRDRRLQAIDEFIDSYEAEHGEITEAEMQEAHRALRQRSIVIRGDSAQRMA